MEDRAHAPIPRRSGTTAQRRNAGTEQPGLPLPDLLTQSAPRSLQGVRRAPRRFQTASLLPQSMPFVFLLPELFEFFACIMPLLSDAHTERAAGFIRQFVGTALVAMPVVTFDPLPQDWKTCVQLDQLRPQFAVLQLGSAPVSPALALAAGDKCAHSLNQVFGVRVKLDPRSASQRPKRLVRRDKFHLGDGRPGMRARHLPTFLSLDYDDTPSIWAWIADRGTVRENAIGLIH